MGLPVSVVMPSRNAAPWVRDAVSSVLAQTFVGFELVVVDDGSEDDTVTIIRSFDDPRIRVLEPGRVGFVRALNLGFREARGEWIARMDADDVVHPQRLDAQIKFLRENPNCLFVSCLRAIMTPNGRFLVPKQRSATQWITAADVTRRRIQFTEGGTVFERRAALEVGLYDEEFENETSLYYKLLARGRGAVLGEVLYAYRLRVDSHSKTIISARPFDTFKVRQRYDPLNAAPIGETVGRGGAGCLELGLISRLVGACVAAGDSCAARRIALTAARRWPFESRCWGVVFKALLGWPSLMRWKRDTGVFGWVATSQPW